MSLLFDALKNGVTGTKNLIHFVLLPFCTNQKIVDNNIIKITKIIHAIFLRPTSIFKIICTRCEKNGNPLKTTQKLSENHIYLERRQFVRNVIDMLPDTGNPLVTGAH